MNNKIFICTHKDYKTEFCIDKITAELYSIITARNIQNETLLNKIETDHYLDDRVFCELANHFYVYSSKLYEQYDRIGFCHYRRYCEDITDYEKYDLVIPTEINQYFNNSIMYHEYHNINDLFLAEKIVQNNFYDYHTAFIEMMDTHILILYNSFIMTKELFEKWTEFVFGVLFIMANTYGIHDYESGLSYVKNNALYYLKTFYPNSNLEYQLRSLFGGLGERLSTAFFIKHINEGKTFKKTNMIITEHTYNRI